MKEKTLLKIALSCSIFGIVLLFFVSERISVKEIDVGKIDETEIGADVRILGTVERVTDTGKVMFLEIGQEKIEKVTVILFKPGEVEIKEGDYVEIIGEVDEYKGKREIIANMVKLIDDNS